MLMDHMQRMPPMDYLRLMPSEIQTEILIRLDFLELHNARQTSRYLRALLMSEAFCRRHNRDGIRSIWNFTHSFNLDDPPQHLVTGIREEDNRTMVFRITFDVEDVDRIEFLRAWSGMLLFSVLNQGYVVFNLWTRTSRVINYGLADRFLPDVANWGTRIATDDDEIEYIVGLFHTCFVIRGEFYCIEAENDPDLDIDEVEQLFVFFSHGSGPPPQLYPRFSVSILVDNLTAAETTDHQLWTIVQDEIEMREASMTQASLRLMVDGQHSPVHLNPVPVGESFLQELGEPLQLWDMGDEAVWTMDMYHCNEGYAMAVDLCTFEVDGVLGQRVSRIRLASMRDDPNGAYHVVATLPVEMLPDEFQVFFNYRIMVVGGPNRFVNLSFQTDVPPGQQSTVIIVRYKIATGMWDTTRALLPADPEDHSHTLSVRLGMSPR